MDLLFDWFGWVCLANKNKNCRLSYSWFQISQTGGQLYSDTSPFSIPCLDVQQTLKGGFGWNQRRQKRSFESWEFEWVSESEDQETIGHLPLKLILQLAHQWESSSTSLWNMCRSNLESKNVYLSVPPKVVIHLLLQLINNLNFFSKKATIFEKNSKPK